MKINKKIKKNKIYIFTTVIFLIIIYYAFGNVKTNCVFVELHKKNTKSKTFNNLILDLDSTIKVWSKKQIGGFEYIDKKDTISPVIFNLDSSRAILYYIRFYEKLTNFQQINCIFVKNKWKFTINGLESYMFSSFDTNEESYEKNFKKLINIFENRGYVDSFKCKINNSLFTDFKFYEMDSYKE